MLLRKYRERDTTPPNTTDDYAKLLVIQNRGTDALVSFANGSRQGNRSVREGVVKIFAEKCRDRGRYL